MNTNITNRSMRRLVSEKSVPGVDLSSTVKIHSPHETALGRHDLNLLERGEHAWLYRCLGAHVLRNSSPNGVRFGLRSPAAKSVSVIGDFNNWDSNATPMTCRFGTWSAFVPEDIVGSRYKYSILTADGEELHKADPFAFFAEVRPGNASIIRDINDYVWEDVTWMTRRRERQMLNQPISIYEVHLASWTSCSRDRIFPSYSHLAESLIPYVKRMGYTHIEILPITEHPFDGSWGYQTTGYFAPTSRYGTPQQFMNFVDQCHQNDIGVILDWVPAHFPKDEFGLAMFDGTPVYEREDPEAALHPEWGTLMFNYASPEVRSFLHSSATMWCDKYHVDGIRVDAVASMLYHDYGRSASEWSANLRGGRTNVEAVGFLRDLNASVQRQFPGVMTIAEESTAWPRVSGSQATGGLGFTMKWNMGYVHDTLKFLGRSVDERSENHGELTFSMVYAWNERFVLSLSHDEMTQYRGSVLSQMPGDEWQKFANMRLLLAYMFAHPGKKLMFQGTEFGSTEGWDESHPMNWRLLMDEKHSSLLRLVQDLNRAYRNEPALHQTDCDPTGFEWIDCSDRQNSVICFVREGTNPDDMVLVVANFQPQVHTKYRVGVPRAGIYQEILNTDAEIYGGSNVGNLGVTVARAAPSHGCQHSITIGVPPLGLLLFRGPARMD